MKTIKFHKGQCGVDFLLNILTEKEIAYAERSTFNTDYFEILLFKKVRGAVVLNQQRITLSDHTILFISPYQKRSWDLVADGLAVTSLIFQEGFLNDFFADKLFTFRLLYFYQLAFPLSMTVSEDQVSKYCTLLREVKQELTDSKADSAHIIRSLVYYLLQSLNREYAHQHELSAATADHNQLPFIFKNLLELHIKSKQRTNDYVALMGVNRIALNRAVKARFNLTSNQLLKQRLLFEVQQLLIHSTKTVSEIASALNFSEPQHLMRFFKAQTGLTTSEFISAFNRQDQETSKQLDDIHPILVS